jgi:hypothetical protein
VISSAWVFDRVDDCGYPRALVAYLDAVTPADDVHE